MAASALPAHAEVHVEPSVQAGATYLDNLTLASSSADKEGEWVGQVAPRLVIRQNSARSVAVLDYTMQNLFYDDHSDLNGTYHQGQASGQFRAIDNWFFIDGYASYMQQAIDPTKPGNFNNLFSTNNQVDQLGASVAPYLKHNFGSVTGEVRYTYGVTRYSGADTTTLPSNSLIIDDSTNTTLSAAFGSTNRSDVLVWDLGGQTTKVDYDTVDDYRFDNVYADAQYQIATSFWLTAMGGEETDLLKSTSAGGLDESYWYGGFRWQPNANNSFEARYGRRFFGDSYGASWTRSARHLQLSVSYSEDPTTDSESASLGTGVPGELQAYRPPNDFTRRTPEPYINKQLQGSIVLTGIRTTLELHVHDTKREYIITGVKETVQGVDFIGTRNLSTTNTLGLQATYEKADLISQGKGRDIYATVTFTHLWSRTFDTTVQVTHLKRSGFGDYDANIASLLVSKRF
ncbi:MAG TPA: TIGR03016 family PEP-CTERM system-associated outer membrane protein [Steroidobacteraceae bacterium]|nr:TIGR03016 family PEP-CTERM system-associated outer membrane protein [Steroidobacteraceae bacterium]